MRRTVACCGVNVSMFMRLRRKSMPRRGFTLIEAIATMVVFAVAAPMSMLMLTDASAARIDAVHAARATWFASAVLEHALADAYSEDENLGFDAMDDTGAYISDLNARIQSDLIDFYNELGFSHHIRIDDVAVSQTGSGWRARVNNNLVEPDYRQITVTVEWTRTTGDEASLSARALVADL